MGTRVDEAAGFIESCLQRQNLPGLRWWQWACLARGLEVDAEGRFVWRRLITSASRQSGKSILLSALALWRSHELGHTVLHTSLNLAQAGAIQEPWWDMAKDEDAYVRRRPDDSIIRWQSGAAWRIRAMGRGVLGMTANMLLLDEAHALDDTEFRWMYPALVERENPQAWLFSAANRDTKVLVPSLWNDDSVAVMHWGAAPQEDIGDPAVWRASSPIWTEQRGLMMADEANTADFRHEWLTQWPDMSRPGFGGWLVGWPDARLPLPSPVGDVVAAVDCDPTGAVWWAVAGWTDADGRVCLTATDELHGIDDAWRWCLDRDAVAVQVGLNHLPHTSAPPGVTASGAGTRETRAGSVPFAAAVSAGRVLHDGTLPVDHARAGTDGALSASRSHGDVTGVKLAIWVHSSLRLVKPAKVKPAIY